VTGFPIGLHQPVEHDGPLPEAADVVIIGGGVIGVMSALFLARKGQKVVLLEKGRIAGEQSSRNWGWIRQTGRDIDELPIAMEANSLWPQLQAELGEDLGLARLGVAYLAEKPQSIERYETWLNLAKPYGVDSRILTPDQTQALLPGATKRYHGALHTPSDMKAEPWVAVPAFARAAVAAGVEIRENCAVRALDLTAGRVGGVISERGRIRADQVLVSGGAWSSLFLRQHGVNIPQLSVQAQVLATDPLPALDLPAAGNDRLAFRRRADGGFTLAEGGWHRLFIGPDAFRHLWPYREQIKAHPFGASYHPAAPAGFPDAWGTKRRWSPDEETPFERMRVLDPKPVEARQRRTLAEFAKLFPALGTPRIKASWSGMIDAMPDIVPVVDHAPIDGLSICTGMCGHGFGIGPAFGRIMADLMTGGDVGHDLTRFRLSRFSDGSKMDMGPGL
jgi:glycine/D-amino acid oxidase-like deaminating enzyme